MAQSSCKCDTKSKSHPGMKLALVRVFSCKHPLILDSMLGGDGVKQKLTKKSVFHFQNDQTG